VSIPILYSRNVNQDLYAQALASVYQSGWRIYDPDYGTSREPDLYEKVRKDPIIASAIDLRLHGVAGKSWRLVPAGDSPVDKLVAKMAEEAIRKVRRFTEARYELAQAVIRNRSYQYIEGERKLLSLAGTPLREWWVPTRLKDVDRRRFRLVPTWEGKDPNTRKLRVYWELFSVVRRRWEKLERPELFVKVVYNDEEGRLGYGRGLLEAMYFYHWIKGRILEEGVQGVEKWARGVIVAEIEGLRVGDTDKTNAALRQKWLDILKEMQSGKVIVHEKGDKISVVESSGTGNHMVLDYIRYLDDAMRSLILGATLPFGGGSGGQGGGSGSLARAEVESDVHEALVQFDREKIDEDLTYDLLGLFFRMNQQNFMELGLGASGMPKFETMQEKRENPKENADVATVLLNAGVSLKKEEVYKRTGWTPPSNDDEIIEGRQQQQVDPMTGMPFGAPPGMGPEGPDHAEEGGETDQAGHPEISPERMARFMGSDEDIEFV